MPQENNKTSDGAVEPRTAPTKEIRQDDALRDTKGPDERGADVKRQDGEEEDLGLCKGVDDMPELKKEDQKMEDEQISLDLSEPPPDVMEYARRELGETDEIKCQMLQELRDMIYGNPCRNIGSRIEKVSLARATLKNVRFQKLIQL